MLFLLIKVYGGGKKERKNNDKDKDEDKRVGILRYG